MYTNIRYTDIVYHKIRMLAIHKTVFLCEIETELSENIEKVSYFEEICEIINFYRIEREKISIK